MDFDYAAELVDRISKGENGGLRQELLRMCIRYFSGLKARWGFHWISPKEVSEELAPDAINDTIFALGDKKGALGVRLQNAFRKCCRQRNRWRRRFTVKELVEKCDVARLPKVTESPLPADTGLYQKELSELIYRELEGHEKASKTAIYEYMRGSSYKEIAVILGKTAHQSRALFWYDIKQIRKNDWLIRYIRDEERGSTAQNAPPSGED